MQGDNFYWYLSFTYQYWWLGAERPFWLNFFFFLFSFFVSLLFGFVYTWSLFVINLILFSSNKRKNLIVSSIILIRAEIRISFFYFHLIRSILSCFDPKNLNFNDKNTLFTFVYEFISVAQKNASVAQLILLLNAFGNRIKCIVHWFGLNQFLVIHFYRWIIYIWKSIHSISHRKSIAFQFQAKTNLGFEWKESIYFFIFHGRTFLVSRWMFLT